MRYNRWPSQAYYNLGVAYSNQKNYEEAISSYKKSIELNSEYADAYYNLGNAWLGHLLQRKILFHWIIYDNKVYSVVFKLRKYRKNLIIHDKVSLCSQFKCFVFLIRLSDQSFKSFNVSNFWISLKWLNKITGLCSDKIPALPIENLGETWKYFAS